MKIEKDTHNISHVQKDLSLARTHKSSMDTLKFISREQIWAGHIARQDRVQNGLAQVHIT